MSNLEHLVEQHVQLYESRMRHVDELAETARSHEGSKDDPELNILLAQQAQLAAYLNDMKLRSVDDWAEEELARAGPMGIWDAVAQQLEAWLERFEHRAA